MSDLEKTWVLRNKQYYVVFPPCSWQAARVFVGLAKQLYGKKLAYAQIKKRYVTKFDVLTAGTLTRRSQL